MVCATAEGAARTVEDEEEGAFVGDRAVAASLRRPALRRVKGDRGGGGVPRPFFKGSSAAPGPAAVVAGRNWFFHMPPQEQVESLCQLVSAPLPPAASFCPPFWRMT